MRMTVLGCLVAAACGGDDLGDETCGLSLRLSGALTSEVEPTDVACAVPLTPRSSLGMRVTFVALGGPSVELAIADVLPEQLGDFPAEVVIDPGEGLYRADCTATLTAHTEVGAGELGTTRYRARGTVTCPAPATPDDGGEPVTIANLDFVVEVAWFD